MGAGILLHTSVQIPRQTTGARKRTPLVVVTIPMVEAILSQTGAPTGQDEGED